MVDKTETIAGTLEDVRALCAVVEFGSISAAASIAVGARVRVLPDWVAAEGKRHAINIGGWAAPARVRVFRTFIRAELSANFTASNGGRNPHSAGSA